METSEKNGVGVKEFFRRSTKEIAQKINENYYLKNLWDKKRE